MSVLHGIMPILEEAAANSTGEAITLSKAAYTSVMATLQAVANSSASQIQSQPTTSSSKEPVAKPVTKRIKTEAVEEHVSN